MELVLEPRLNVVVRTELNGQLVVLLPGMLTCELLNLARALLTGDELRQLVEVAQQNGLLRLRPVPAPPPEDRDPGELTEAG